MADQRVALIVAIDQYADKDLRRLAAPVADAQALAEALSDPDLGAFDVEVVANEPSYVVRERVDAFFVDRAPRDLALLHFSCHGIKDDSGELYLAATDTRTRLLGSTAVDASFVSRSLRRSRARRAVLLLDCCYGGAFERGMIPRSGTDVHVGHAFDQQQLGGGRGRVVITASNAMEYAFEDSKLVDPSEARPSLFTGAFVEGLTTGRADRDHDGRVSLGELYEFVYDRVREQTPHQTPSKWEFGVQGELIIARNPQLRVVPSPLPPELEEAMEHPLAATRFGVVDELGRLIEGTNLPLAAGARTAVARMVDDDSRRVSAAAAEILERTALRLSTESVDLGEIAVGESDAGVTVEIEGPPLATASHPKTSSPGLSARRVERTIRIDVNTASARTLDGTVTVTGPAGSANVRIRGTIRDPEIAAALQESTSTAGPDAHSEDSPSKRQREAALDEARQDALAARRRRRQQYKEGRDRPSMGDELASSDQGADSNTAGQDSGGGRVNPFSGLPPGANEPATTEQPRPRSESGTPDSAAQDRIGADVAPTVHIDRSTVTDGPVPRRRALVPFAATMAGGVILVWFGAEDVARFPLLGVVVLVGAASAVLVGAAARDAASGLIGDGVLIGVAIFVSGFGLSIVLAGLLSTASLLAVASLLVAISGVATLRARRLSGQLGWVARDIQQRAPLTVGALAAVVALFWSRAQLGSSAAATAVLVVILVAGFAAVAGLVPARVAGSALLAWCAAWIAWSMDVLIFFGLGLGDSFLYLLGFAVPICTLAFRWIRAGPTR